MRGTRPPRPLRVAIALLAVLATRSPAADCDENGVDDAIDIATGAATDCNQNGAPDSCDIAGGASHDCDRDGVPDECQEDCNENGIRDICEVWSGEETDCDRDGVLDSCALEADCDGDLLPDACERDCDRSGVPDDCELRDGVLADENHNGLPDICEGEPIFFGELRVETPRVEDSPAHGPVQVEVWLHTAGVAPGEPGAQGWSVGVEMRGCSPGLWTTDGTVGARVDADPPGLQSSGFDRTEHFHVLPESPVHGVSSAVVLSFTMPVTLPPEDSPHLILRGTIEGRVPEEGFCSPCVLRIGDSPLGFAQGVQSLVTFGGSSHPLLTDSARVDFCFTPFHRGDADDDGVVNITDAIVIVSWLFLGATRPSCLDAADADASRRLELTDAIVVLDWLFGSRPALPTPGAPPAPCDIDRRAPLGSRPGCESYDSCAVTERLDDDG